MSRQEIEEKIEEIFERYNHDDCEIEFMGFDCDDFKKKQYPKF